MARRRVSFKDDQKSEDKASNSDTKQSKPSLECSICLSEVEPAHRAQLKPCGHRFCIECVNQWTQSRDTCSYCRQKATHVEWDFSGDDNQAANTRQLEPQVARDDQDDQGLFAVVSVARSVYMSASTLHPGVRRLHNTSTTHHCDVIGVNGHVTRIEPCSATEIFLDVHPNTTIRIGVIRRPLAPALVSIEEMFVRELEREQAVREYLATQEAAIAAGLRRSRRVRRPRL